MRSRSHLRKKGINIDRKCIRCNESGTVSYYGKYCERCKREYMNMYRWKAGFKFNVYDYPTHFDLSLIERYGWYSASNRGGNLNGVSRDHLYSVHDGFVNGIEPSIISHPANCRLVLHRDNQKKKNKSSITLEKLLERIKDFEKTHVWPSGEAQVCKT